MSTSEGQRIMEAIDATPRYRAGTASTVTGIGLTYLRALRMRGQLPVGAKRERGWTLYSLRDLVAMVMAREMSGPLSRTLPVALDAASGRSDDLGDTRFADLHLPTGVHAIADGDCGVLLLNVGAARRRVEERILTATIDSDPDPVGE